MNEMRILKLLSILLLATLSLLAHAAPESAHYRFDRQLVESPDGQRHYRLDLAIPRRAPPASGYPVVYLLDGNNVLAELREEWLAELDSGNPPVLVMIGYDTDKRYDPQRNRDYTGTRSADFLKMLKSQIKPLIQTEQPIDQSRQMLWGHSYGGLFTLFALFEDPSAFQTYFAVSPSLRFQPETFAKGMGFVGFQQGETRQVLILRGSEEGKTPVVPLEGDSPEHRQAIANLPKDAGRLLAQYLASVPGIHASYQEFEGATHPQMFINGLQPALRMAAGLGD
ncbi:MAG: hypothetical protein JWQ69_3797 [Pseudomonas sp.]|nr:hypothetical protein [Pseudomonas sp.]